MSKKKLIAVACGLAALGALVLACSSEVQEDTASSEQAASIPGAQTVIKTYPRSGERGPEAEGYLFVPSTVSMTPPTANMYIDEQFIASVKTGGDGRPTEAQDGTGRRLGFGLLYTYAFELPEDFEDNAEHAIGVYFATSDGKPLTSLPSGGGNGGNNNPGGGGGGGSNSCASYSSCGSCVAKPGCGWCGGTATNPNDVKGCVPGSSMVNHPNCMGNRRWSYGGAHTC